MLAEAQVFGWVGEPAIWTRGDELLLKESCLSAGCQGRPGPNPPEETHFAGLLFALVTGAPGGGRLDVAVPGEALHPAQVELALLNTLKLSGTPQLSRETVSRADCREAIIR